MEEKEDNFYVKMGIKSSVSKLNLEFDVSVNNQLKSFSIALKFSFRLNTVIFCLNLNVANTCYLGRRRGNKK